jgi:hypothetical protein
MSTAVLVHGCMDRIKPEPLISQWRAQIQVAKGYNLVLISTDQSSFDGRDGFSSMARLRRNRAPGAAWPTAGRVSISAYGAPNSDLTLPT